MCVSVCVSHGEGGSKFGVGVGGGKRLVGGGGCMINVWRRKEGS